MAGVGLRRKRPPSPVFGCKLGFMGADSTISQASSPRRAGGRSRLLARAFGNVLLGFSTGLLLYYAVTDISTLIDQRALRAEFPAMDARIVQPDDDDSGPALDMEGWQRQDLDYWTGLEEGDAFGRLSIERIDLDVVVVNGHSRDSLKRGPAWIDYTDLPGERGNVGIAGHRTTFGAPFRRLDELQVGDGIELHSPFRVYRYRVVYVFRVTPDRVDVMDSTEEPMLTLSACDPPFSARYRLIVQAELVETRRFEQ